jgi:hypothetical protein
MASGGGDCPSSEWIQIPPPPLLRAKSVPYLVDDGMVPHARRYFQDAGAHWFDIDIAAATTVSDVIDAIRSVLPFPSWAASGWDSVEDAFEEIRAGWTFPLVLACHGLPALLHGNPHLALETNIRLDGLQNAFSIVKDQFVVLYPAETWS